MKKVRGPSYRLHKPTGLGVVTLSGKDFYLGPYDSSEARQQYLKLLSEWEASSRSQCFGEPTEHLSMAQVALSYLEHAKEYYGPESSEYVNLKLAVRPISGLYADFPAQSFGPAEFNRPGLQAAIELARRTKSALVVYSLSRLARSTKDTIAIGEQLDTAGADLVSLSERIDTTSAAGKMIFRMLAVMAEFERDQVSERTTMALRHKQSKGERVGTVPYGFDLAKDGKRLIENAFEQEVIAEIHTLRAKGYTYRDIAVELEQRRIPTKKGNKWQAATIRNLAMRAA